MGTGFPKGRRLYVSALQIWQGSGSFRQWLYSPVYFSMNYRAKENLGYLYWFLPSKAPPLSSSFDPKGSGKHFFGKIAAARQFLSNFIQVLILNVSLIWLRDLRNLSSWVPILKRVHSQRSSSPAAPWKFNIYGGFLKWGYPQIIQVTDGHFSIETTMVTTGDPPWLKKHHGCSNTWCPVDVLHRDWQGMATWKWFLPRYGMTTEKIMQEEIVVT